MAAFIWVSILRIWSRLVDLLSMAPHGGIWGDQWTVQRLSHIIAEVTFLHASPPRLVSFVIKLLCNLQAEIITLCHAIIQVHVIIVTVNDASVEIVIH
jgi:hypothetical protein